MQSSPPWDRSPVQRGFPWTGWGWPPLLSPRSPWGGVGARQAPEPACPPAGLRHRREPPVFPSELTFVAGETVVRPLVCELPDGRWDPGRGVGEGVPQGHSAQLTRGDLGVAPAPTPPVQTGPCKEEVCSGPSRPALAAALSLRADTGAWGPPPPHRPPPAPRPPPACLGGCSAVSGERGPSPPARPPPRPPPPPSSRFRPSLGLCDLELGPPC